MNDEAKQTEEVSSTEGIGQGQANEEDIIDLTEVAEEDFLSSEEEGAFDEEGGEISLDTTALEEEEEIVELVDVAEEGEEIEEPLDLSGLVEEETEEGQTEPGVSEAIASESEGKQEDGTEEIGMELQMDEAATDSSGTVDTQDALDYPLELEEDALETSVAEDAAVNEEEDARVGEALVDESVSPTVSEPADMNSEGMQDAVRAVVAERLTDEKLEAIVTEEIRQTIRDKAERILLEVAEKAVAEEMERIKKAL
jgi:hypothetical protein